MQKRQAAGGAPGACPIVTAIEQAASTLDTRAAPDLLRARFSP